MAWLFSCFRCKPKHQKCFSSSTIRCTVPTNKAGLISTNLVRTQAFLQEDKVDVQIYSDKSLDSTNHANDLDRSLISLFGTDSRCCPPRKCSSNHLLQLEVLQDLFHSSKGTNTSKLENAADLQAGDILAEEFRPCLTRMQAVVKLADNEPLIGYPSKSSIMTQIEASSSMARERNASSPNSHPLDRAPGEGRQGTWISPVDQSEDEPSSHKGSKQAKEVKLSTAPLSSEVSSVANTSVCKLIPGHLEQQVFTRDLECLLTNKETSNNDNVVMSAETDGELSETTQATSMTSYQNAIFHDTDISVIEPEPLKFCSEKSHLTPQSWLQWIHQGNAEQMPPYSKVDESQISILEDNYDGFSDTSSQSFIGCDGKSSSVDNGELNHDRKCHCSDASSFPCSPTPQKPSKINKIFAKNGVNVSLTAVLKEHSVKSNARFGEVEDQHKSSLESNAICCKSEHHQKLDIACPEGSENWCTRPKHKSFDLDAWISFKQINNRRIISPANTRDEENMQIPSSAQLSDEVMSPPLHSLCVSPQELIQSAPWTQSKRLLVEEIEPRTPSSPSLIEMPCSLESTASPVNLSRQSSLMGTMRAHWNHSSSTTKDYWDGKGIPNSTNKYKEDQKVNWHATPFEVRLERALAKQSPSFQKKLFGATAT